MSERELALVAAVEVHTFLDGNITRHPETHFLDFVVDGRSVREMVDGARCHVTELCRPWLHAVDRAGYEAMLRSAFERVSTMPYDELEHRGRGFLWPWQWGWRMPKTDTEE